MKRTLFTWTILALPLLGWGQTLVYTDSGLTWANTITAEDLSDHLYVLAADSMEGRETGKEGQRKAAAYIASHFEAAGLEPVQGSYFQDVPLKVSQLKGGILTWGGSKLLFKNDWVPYPGIEASNVEGDVVFAGYGIQDEGWDDYAGLDVRGRMVVMLAGEPGDEERGFELTGTDRPSRWSQDRNAKRELADSLGASAVLVVTEEYDVLKSRLVPWLSRERMRLDVDREGEGTDLPTLLISQEALLAVSGWKSTKVVEKKWPKRKLKNTMWPDGKLSIARMDDKVMATNVWGLLPGTDSTLADEIVVLTSHYDHVGVDAEGLIYNGADDDGSGTVSLLENVEAWTEAYRAGQAPGAPFCSWRLWARRKGCWDQNGTATTPHFRWNSMSATSTWTWSAEWMKPMWTMTGTST